MARFGWNPFSVVVAVVGLGGCPGDDVTSPMSTEGGSSTSGASSTSRGATTLPGTTGSSTGTLGGTSVAGTTVGETTAGETTRGVTTRGETTFAGTTVAESTDGDSSAGDSSAGGSTAGGTGTTYFGTTFGETTYFGTSSSGTSFGATSFGSTFGETTYYGTTYFGSSVTGGGFDCGNDMIDGGETCDGSDLGGEDCESLGFESGMLACLPGCFNFDVSQCVGEGGCCVANGTPGCGDMACTAAICAEDPFCCDTEWDGLCASAATTEPVCQGVSNCPDCGNGMLEPAEICDGDDLDGETCETQGFDSGTLACAANCQDFQIAQCVASGPCCTSNPTVGCEAGVCMESICAFDPFCCEVQWDGACASSAQSVPACQGVSDCPG